MIVIAGGSGYIGKVLTRNLLDKGYTVVIVDKLPPSFTHEKLFFIQCDIVNQVIPFNALDQATAVINLVGNSIFHKWTNSYKEEIRQSRVNSTKKIVESIKTAKNKPNIFINASAVGFYGERQEELLTENSKKGDGFFSDLVFDWEKEAFKVEELSIRTVCIRTAIVLGKSGGMLSILNKFSRLGFFLNLTKKDFWQPWISEKDLINIYIFALETSTLHGVVNAVAPEEVTHKIFIKSIMKFLKRKILGTIPKKINEIIFGDLVNEITVSQRILPEKLLDKGFVYKYPTLNETLSDIYTK